MSMSSAGLEKLDAIVEWLLRTARIPGIGLAVVTRDVTLLVKGYGYRDLAARLPLTSKTVYPIASTTKSINAVLLGMLVDEGKLDWDIPVRRYLPRFSLREPRIAAQVTLRDLITMRTGLPRHDWVRTENPMTRADLVEVLQHLELSAGYRERFQYNNLTVTIAGHIAELAGGRSWEELVRERILEPLEMRSTGFSQPASDDVTRTYHENIRRELLVSERFLSEFMAPSGAAIHSTLEDMARWMAFNLDECRVGGRALLQPRTLAEIRSPQVPVGSDPSAPSPAAAYALGWFVDTYNSCPRWSHSGYLHDVSSDVALFPEHAVAIACFSNFGAPMPARLINQRVFDLLMGFETTQTFEQRLAEYERKIEETRLRSQAVPRVQQTAPSHPLADYAGVYSHPGYGAIGIQLSGPELALRRNRLVLPLQHWHYDAWIAKESELFLIHVPHAFDATSRLLFETDVDGRIAAVSIALEPAVAPIRFVKT